MEKQTNWLEEATNFNIYYVSELPQVREITNILYAEVKSKLGVTRKENRYKDAIQAILLNLYVGWRMGLPVRYSRNSNDYNHNKRYGLLFFRYKRFIGTVDALEELGYICQNNGFFESDRGLGRQSRGLQKS